MLQRTLTGPIATFTMIHWLYLLFSCFSFRSEEQYVGLIVLHIHLHENGLWWVTPDTFWKLLWFHVTEMHKPSQIWAQPDGKEVYMDGLTSQRSGKWCVWLQLLEALNKYHNPNLFPQFQYSFVINTNVRWSTETWFIKKLIICFLLCHIL